MPLKLNGKPFSLHRTSPTSDAIRRCLDKSAPDELFTPDELSKRTGVSANTIRSNGLALNGDLPGYTMRVGNIRYWGNPKAIVALQKQLEAGQ